MIIAIDAEKLLEENSKFISNKNSQQSRNRRELAQTDNGHLQTKPNL